MDSANVSLEDRKGDVGVIWVLDVLSRKGRNDEMLEWRNVEALRWDCSDRSARLVKVIVDGGCVEDNWRLSKLGNWETRVGCLGSKAERWTARESLYKWNGLPPTVNIMLIAPAKTLGREGSISPTRFCEPLVTRFTVLSTQWRKEMRMWGSSSLVWISS